MNATNAQPPQISKLDPNYEWVTVKEAYWTFTESIPKTAKVVDRSFLRWCTSGRNGIVAARVGERGPIMVRKDTIPTGLKPIK